MGALREVLASTAFAPEDARAAAADDVARLADDERVRVVTDVGVIDGESRRWYDGRSTGTLLLLNWHDAPLPERVVEGDRRWLAGRSLRGRAFELYNDPAVLGPEARQVYAQAGDTIRRSDVPFHAHLFGGDFAYLHLDLDPGGRTWAYRVSEPELLADLRTVFLHQWRASEPLLSGLQGGDVLEVVGALVSGLTDEAAAARLNLSLRTYRRRVAELQRLLGARGRFAAGVEADRRGLVELSSVHHHLTADLDRPAT